MGGWVGGCVDWLVSGWVWSVVAYYGWLVGGPFGGTGENANIRRTQVQKEGREG